MLAGTVIGTGVTAAATLRDSGSGYAMSETSTDGLTDLDVDVAGGSLTIAYGDVSEAQLEVGSGADGWTFERQGSTLRVSSPQTNFVGWSNGAGSATLVLPRASATTNLDARIQVAGGALSVDADFGSLNVQLAGGDVDLAGDVRTLDVSVSGGSASGTLTGVGDATFEVAGGSLASTLAGDAPARTRSRSPPAPPTSPCPTTSTTSPPRAVSAGRQPPAHLVVGDGGRGRRSGPGAGVAAVVTPARGVRICRRRTVRATDSDPSRRS